MNKIVAAVKSTDWVIVYRGLLLFVLGITAWLAIEVYNSLRDGSTASAQTAQKAVAVAVAAKTSIASVATDVAVIQSKQADGELIQAHISEQVDKLADIQGAQSSQLSAISQKLDDMASRERVGVNSSAPSFTLGRTEATAQ